MRVIFWRLKSINVASKLAEISNQIICRAELTMRLASPPSSWKASLSKKKKTVMTANRSCDDIAMRNKQGLDRIMYDKKWLEKIILGVRAQD